MYSVSVYCTCLLLVSIVSVYCKCLLQVFIVSIASVYRKCLLRLSSASVYCKCLFCLRSKLLKNHCFSCVIAPTSCIFSENPCAKMQKTQKSEKTIMFYMKNCKKEQFCFIFLVFFAFLGLADPFGQGPGAGIIAAA